MVVCRKEVINMWQYYSQHYISGSDLSTHGEEWQRQGLCFCCFTQTFNGKLKKKIHSLYPCYSRTPLASISFQVPGMKDPGEGTEDDMVPFLSSSLTWARLFQFLYFPAQLFWNFISLLTKPACPKVCFLEYWVCRMLIDMTWKKSFELNRFLYCWASFSDSLVCDVSLWEGNVLCSISHAYVPWMNLFCPLSLSFSLSLY